jgi:hypothetical protein
MTEPVELSILDVTGPDAYTLDGRPLPPKTQVTISRGRRHPDGRLSGTEVRVGGVEMHGVQVVRDGRIIAAIPEE